MGKNNKGFTLIELLAAIAILSILMVLALPQITNLIGNNRDKVYISDALKMISQAEYKLRSNSTVIEKPDDGECIIFSLNYLDNNSFDNPPNKGEYLRYASFVVVKNNNGKMEYSALLVEQYKENNYKGVKLTKEADLNKGDAVKNVTPFDKDAIVYITDDISEKYLGAEAANRTIGIEYINSFLGNNYVKAVNDRLVDEIVEQDDDVENLGVPRINSFVAMSASGKDYNSLDMKILVEAKDTDSPPADLSVYYNICTPHVKANEPSMCSYPDVSNPGAGGYPYSTGGSSTFSSPVIHLDACSSGGTSRGDLCAKYGDEVIIYLVVTDKDGNFVQKQKTYAVHTNQPPVIRDFRITRRDGDSANFLKAKVVLDVSDDIDGYGSLKYCITEDENARVQDCTDFRPLNGPTFNYDFCTGDIFSAACMPDGSTRKLKIFVKDSIDDVDPPSKTATYDVYRFNVGSLTPTVSFTSAGSDVPTGENSLLVRYSINIPFDPDSGITESDITYILGICESDESCNTPLLQSLPISYETTKNGTYRLYGSSAMPIYDGRQRRLSVKVLVAKYGLNANAAQIKTIERYTPYLNKPPQSAGEFRETFISRVDNFTGQSSPESGTYNTTFRYSGYDDLDKKDFWTCLSETSTGCDFTTQAEFDSKFKKYTENTDFTFTPSNTALPYDGSTKTLYMKMCDKYYLTPNMNSCTTITPKYKIYENDAPKIKDFDIVSNAEEYNSYETTVTLKLSDDLEDVSGLKVELTDGIETVSGRYGDLFDNDYQTRYVFGNHEYDGQTRTLKVTVSDSYNSETVANYTYDVSLNHAPTVHSFRVERTADVWQGDFPVTDSMAKGNYEASVILNVDDQDTWDGGKIKYCLTESSTGCSSDDDFVLYNEIADISHTFRQPDNSRPYEFRDNRTLYLKVRDSLGAQTNESAVYKIYENQGPKATIVPTIEPDYTGITSEAIIEDGIHVNTITVASDFIDDFDQRSDLTVRVGYRVKDSGNDYSYTEEQALDDILSFTIGGSSFKYDGATYELIVQAKDSYGKYTSSPAVTEYQVYNNTSPTIVTHEFRNKCREITVEVEQDDGTFESVTQCEEESGINETTFYMLAYVKDYFDTYNICVSESSSKCTDYTTENYSGDNPYTGYQSKEYTLATADYSGNTPTNVYLYIKDGQGFITKKKISYAVYKACSSDDNKVETNISYVPKNDSNKVTPKKCSGDCYFKTGDNTSSTRKFQYTRNYDLMDKYIEGFICSTGHSAEDTRYCSHETCFYNENDMPTYWLIGNEVQKSETELTYSGPVTALNNKKFKKYHLVYKLETETSTSGTSITVLRLHSEVVVPDEIVGMTSYNFRNYFKFDENDDQSYLVFDD